MTEPAEGIVSFVVTNYNGSRNLKRCLPYVLEAAAASGVCDDVLVVDDCSSDDSLELLRERFPQVRVLALDTRSSFLGACNAGFRAAKNPLVALLSNDMAPEPDFVTKLLKHLKNPDVFAVQATLVSPEGRVESERNIGRFLFGNFKMLNTAKANRGLTRMLLPQDRDSSYSLYSGACGLFDRAKFLELGGLDAIYLPFYWEDADLCFRAWRRGWKTLSEPGCFVYHFHEELGTIRNNFDKGFVRTVERRNRFLFLWSNIDNPAHLFEHLLYLLVNLIFSLFVGRFSFYRSFGQALMRLPQVLRKRRERGNDCWSDDQIFATVLGQRRRGAGAEKPVVIARAA
ncbi:MAG: glycosyltransferase family 2 protein [Candidatus Wallbacteria bacterium]|nr:glycosyltransferase family 2 protein [Candidatus Wallbacteria bacterium]